MNKKKTDRMVTEKEEEMENLIVSMGLLAILRTLRFVAKHPESKLWELLTCPAESFEEFNQTYQSLIKDPKSKFELEHIMNEQYDDLFGAVPLDKKEVM